MSARWEAFLGRGFVDFAYLPSGTMSLEEAVARTLLSRDFQTTWLVLQVLPDCINVTVHELQSSSSVHCCIQQRFCVSKVAMQCMACAREGKVFFRRSLSTAKVS